MDRKIHRRRTNRTGEQIEQVLIKSINQMLCDKDDFLATLHSNIETILSQDNEDL